MYLLHNNLLFQDTESGGSGGQTPELTADDILNELNKNDKDDDNNSTENESDESEKTEDDIEGTKKSSSKKDSDSKDDEKEDEEESEEDKELKELEEELKEPTDEDLELKAPVQRRALLKDFPDIFKKHPGLESTIYRERAYTELLPTIQDAKNALNAVQTLDSFEKALGEGDTVPIMKAMLAEDPKGFAKLADNYMDNLRAVDERAYLHTIGNVTKDIVEAMLGFGKEKEDKEVLNAASILYQFMFNTTKWQGKQKLSVDEVLNDSTSKERQKLDEDKKNFEESKLKEYTDKAMLSVENQIKGTIEKSIDSKNEMSSFVKNKAIEEVQKKADNLLKKDSRFQAIIVRLKEQARKENFTPESINRIKSAYFTRYKSILLPIIKSVRQEALKGSVKKIKENVETNDTTERANRGRQSTRNSNDGNNQDRSKPLPGESSLDFLLRR